jgi:AraC-like DNA-binding protein
MGVTEGLCHSAEGTNKTRIQQNIDVLSFEIDDVWSILQPELNKRLQDITQESSFKERVWACLVEMLASGHYSMADVASKLAMSSRTLHRRLKDPLCASMDTTIFKSA